jgi:hypothetical protein
LLGCQLRRRVFGRGHSRKALTSSCPAQRGRGTARRAMEGASAERRVLHRLRFASSLHGPLHRAKSAVPLPRSVSLRGGG